MITIKVENKDTVLYTKDEPQAYILAIIEEYRMNGFAKLCQTAPYQDKLGQIEFYKYQEIKANADVH